MPTRRVFILTQDGSILPESTKKQIQIMLNDSDDTHYQYMEGDDWLPAYRVGYNLHPQNALVFHEHSDTRNGFFVFTDPSVLKQISDKLIQTDKARTSWEVVRDFVNS